MAKQKKPRKNRPGKDSIMDRSDIPYAKRINMQHNSRIAANRHQSAKAAMFCLCVAIHKVKGVGYKKLVEFSLRYKEVEDEIYEDLEVGMDHAKRRMEQIGMPISGELYAVVVPGLTKREQQVFDHGLEAAQVATISGAIAMNDVFGYGKIVQERISREAGELSRRYKKEGMGWLLEEMEEIGFLVVDGEVRAFLGDDGKAITPARARKEGIANEC